MSAFKECEREMTKGRARWQHHFILELLNKAGSFWAALLEIIRAERLVS